VREIRMLRATWRGLETWHVERPAGAPVLDPTGKRDGETCLRKEMERFISTFTVVSIVMMEKR
jgi:hypothetical protein